MILHPKYLGNNHTELWIIWRVYVSTLFTKEGWSVIPTCYSVTHLVSFPEQFETCAYSDPVKHLLSQSGELHGNYGYENIATKFITERGFESQYRPYSVSRFV